MHRPDKLGYRAPDRRPPTWRRYGAQSLAGPAVHAADDGYAGAASCVGPRSRIDSTSDSRWKAGPHRRLFVQHGDATSAAGGACGKSHAHRRGGSRVRKGGEHAAQPGPVRSRKGPAERRLCAALPGRRAVVQRVLVRARQQADPATSARRSSSILRTDASRSRMPRDAGSPRCGGTRTPVSATRMPTGLSPTGASRGSTPAHR